MNRDLYGLNEAAADAWQDLAAAVRHASSKVPCTGPRSPWWTSEDPEERTAAAFRCTGCPAIGLCRRYADIARERHHVWAGEDRTRRPATPTLEISMTTPTTDDH